MRFLSGPLHAELAAVQALAQHPGKLTDGEAARETDTMLAAGARHLQQQPEEDGHDADSRHRGHLLAPNPALHRSNPEERSQLICSICKVDLVCMLCCS